MVRIFIGVAWPYANGPFHIGHLAGAYLPGDTFARYHRLRGNEVLMVSGSDMHGTPILVTAEQGGESAEAVAGRFDALHRETFRRLGFTFDLYTSTHTLVHERVVQDVFLRLIQAGYVDRRTEDLPFCPKHKRFLPDRYVTGECPICHFPTARGDECDNCGNVLEPRRLIQPRCALDSTPAEFRPSEHFYLRLDKLQPAIERFIAEKQDWRPNVIGESRRFLEAGLHPTAITRDLDWGIPLPVDGYPTKRFYVWFDAVIGYLSASREWAIRSGKPEAWRRYWDTRERARHYYFIGKDNIFHHAIVLPGILLGHGELPLPYDIPANEWLRIGGGKISKSRPGEADVFVPSLLSEYPPDVIRFYAAQMAPQNHDTDFSWEEFHQLANEVLANQYGNLVQRLLVLARDRYGGRVPSPPEGWSPEAVDGIAARISAAHARIGNAYEAVQLKEALETALGEIRAANRTFHEARPWSSTDAERRKVVYETLWLVKAAAIWLSPVLPFSSAELFRQLGFSEGPLPGSWDEVLRPVPADQPLGEIRPLFPKKDSLATATTSSEGVARNSERPALPPLEIRSAKVRSVREHPGADKLYIMDIDLGDGAPRTIVAGLRGFYPKESLVDTSLVVLTNLQPRTIRKVTSQGMLLAADDGEAAVLLRPPAATRVGDRAPGMGEDTTSVSYDQFAAHPLVTSRVLGSGLDGGSRVDVGGREVAVPGAWPVDATVVVRLDSPGAISGTVLAFGEGRPAQLDRPLPPGRRVR